jgi:hydrogenase maturation protease
MKLAATDQQEANELAVVICFGSPVRGDDGVGRAVASALMACRCSSAVGSLYVVFAHQLTPELALPLSGASVAIFVDAAADLSPGEVDCRRVRADGRNASYSLCHHQSIGTVLAFAEQLFGSVPESWAITVGGVQWGYGTELSPPVRAAVSKVLQDIDSIRTSRGSLTTSGLRGVAVARAGG